MSETAGAAEARIPLRGEIAQSDTWDLSGLFPSDEAWAEGLGEYERMAEGLPSFRGTLAQSAESLAGYMGFIRDLGILGERLGYYAMLRQSEDEASGAARAMSGKIAMAGARADAASAWDRPEILAIPEADMEKFLAHPGMADYAVYLRRILRCRPHILGDREERILALHSEGESVPEEAFSALTNADLDFGMVDTPEGRRPLSQSSWSLFMEHPDRDVRRRAYLEFYARFDSHKTTLAALYSGAVKRGAISARIRGHSSARAAALFADSVGEEVYDSLVAAVGESLPALHRYYALRKRALGLSELRHYDAYAPLVKAARKKTPWAQAVDLISQALAPLGDEYVSAQREGLLGRWADRYESKGKRSGAFSAGSFTGDPYILMNYKEDSIRDLFTLAHEGGHSMHSLLSARSNPFMHYGYTIFEAEVASTFNEELLFRHLEKSAAFGAGESGSSANGNRASSGGGANGEGSGASSGARELRLYLLSKRADDLLATLFRQTMFAEFEHATHALEEGGTPLTVEVLRAEYRRLLEKYFGPDMALEEASDLEGLRIPHFYRPFYVYKYATGISAALALAQRVLGGGEKERSDYFAFLKSGGSRFPIDALRLAGVDMASPAPVRAACAVFAGLVGELERLL